jgi:diaminohydroxyphosphoribosylaminopyrimidine deaminase/5-amino-6-(5-phosphoribosylamino)uracil reductase
MDLRLPKTLQLFDGKVKTIVFNAVKAEEHDNLVFYQIKKDESLVRQISGALYALNIQSVLVEGGSTLLQSFIDEALYDEVRIITNNTPATTAGIKAPHIPDLELSGIMELKTDSIHFYQQKAVSR